MTAQGPSGPARPARLAGLILIGVAVVAVGVGVFTLSGNGSPQSSAGRAPAATTVTPGPPARTTTATTASRPASTHPTTASPTSQPPTSGSFPSGQTTIVVPPPTGVTGPPTAAAIGVRVYNNSLIKDLAETGADDLRNAGFNVISVGNYSEGVIDTTTAYYNPTAPGEQQVADQIAQQFGMKVAPRFPGIAFASPGVIVILTKDFRGNGTGGGK